MDQTFCNFNPDAEEDDGSTEGTPGCTDDHYVIVVMLHVNRNVRNNLESIQPLENELDAVNLECAAQVTELLLNNYTTLN